MSRLILVAVALLVGCVEHTKTTPAGKKVYSREEFRELVMGKTPAEVIKAMGRPDDAMDDSEGKPDRWIYRGRVLNPTTQKAESPWVYFEDGKVYHINW